MTYALFYNYLVLNNFFVQLYIKVFLFITTSLPILLLVQLRKRIRSIRKEISYYYCIVITFSMPFFKSSWNPQVLFLFQFFKPLYSQRTYFRPISDFLYRYFNPKSNQCPYPLVAFLFLPHFNLILKSFLVFSQSTSSCEILQIRKLYNFSINYLIIRLNTLFTYYRILSLYCGSSIFLIICLNPSLYITSLYSYPFLRVLNPQPFTFIKCQSGSLSYFPYISRSNRYCI